MSVNNYLFSGNMILAANPNPLISTTSGDLILTSKNNVVRVPPGTAFVSSMSIPSTNPLFVYNFSPGTLTTNTNVFLPSLPGNDTFVFANFTQTLTNKTLILPVINSISNGGTVTIPTGTQTLVGRSTVDTLTNKTLTSSTNTITAKNLGTSADDVVVNTNSPGSADYLLITTSPTNATWQAKTDVIVYGTQYNFGIGNLQTRRDMSTEFTDAIQIYGTNPAGETIEGSSILTDKLPIGVYRITWYYEYAINVRGPVFKTQLLVDGRPQAEFYGTVASEGIYGTEGRIYNNSGTKVLSFTSSDNHTIQLQYGKGDDPGEVEYSIANVFVELYRIM